MRAAARRAQKKCAASVPQAHARPLGRAEFRSRLRQCVCAPLRREVRALASKASKHRTAERSSAFWWFGVKVPRARAINNKRSLRAALRPPSRICALRAWHVRSALVCKTLSPHRARDTQISVANAIMHQASYCISHFSGSARTHVASRARGTQPVLGPTTTPLRVPSLRGRPPRAIRAHMP